MASIASILTTRRFSTDFAQADLEFAKWTAIVTMVIDHYGKVVDDSVFVQTHAIGRVSFPLFAAIIAIRLTTRPNLYARYLRCLIPWAIVSQPVFVLVGRAWDDGNILFTLALGVNAAWLLCVRSGLSDPARGVGVAVIFALSAFVDYGPLGVAMIPVMVFLTTRYGYSGAAAVGPLGLTANLDMWLPPLMMPDLTALLATPILLFSLSAKIRLPRLPTQVFYGFYPAHLLILHLYDLYT